MSLFLPKAQAPSPFSLPSSGHHPFPLLDHHFCLWAINFFTYNYTWISPILINPTFFLPTPSAQKTSHCSSQYHSKTSKAVVHIHNISTSLSPFLSEMLPTALQSKLAKVNNSFRGAKIRASCFSLFPSFLQQNSAPQMTPSFWSAVLLTSFPSHSPAVSLTSLASGILVSFLFFIWIKCCLSSIFCLGPFSLLWHFLQR